MGVVRQAESAALKAAGLTETGKKSGTFKRELAAVFSQVSILSVRRGSEPGSFVFAPFCCESIVGLRATSWHNGRRAWQGAEAEGRQEVFLEVGGAGCDL